jgi:hypothetical protein
MDNKDFIAEAIQYQKSASDQVFEILSLYRRNSDNYILEAMDQFVWIPEQSKEQYQSWSDACDETTVYLKSLIDAGFDQIEEALNTASPAETIFSQKPAEKKAEPPKPVEVKAVEKKETPAAKPKAPATTRAAATKKPAAKTTAAKPARRTKAAATAKPAAKETSATEPKATSPAAKTTPPAKTDSPAKTSTASK